MNDWKDGPGQARATFVFRAGNGPAKTKRIEGGVDHVRILDGGKQEADTLAVRNDGPDTISVIGWTETTCDDSVAGEIEIDDKTPFGALQAGEEREWPRRPREAVTVTALPQAVTWRRGEFLKWIREAEGRNENAGEALVDRYLRARKPGIRWERIPETRERKTPDRRVWLGSAETIWEIKSIEDDRIAREIPAGVKEDGCYAGTTAKHTAVARRRAREAAEQLRGHSQKGLPTVLVLVNFVEYDPCALDGDRIAETLYGNSVATPCSNNGSGYRITHRREETDTRFSSISAVAALEWKLQRPPWREGIPRYKSLCDDSPLVASLTIYHNANADVPLDVKMVAGARLKQMEYGPVPDGRAFAAPASRWVPVHAADGTVTAADPENRDRLVMDTSREGVVAEITAIEAERRKRSRKDAADEIEIDRRTTVIGPDVTPAQEPGLDRIEKVSDRCGGAAVIRGSRITAITILGRIGAGMSIEEIVRDLKDEGIAADDVRAAARYASLVLEGMRNERGSGG